MSVPFFVTTPIYYVNAKPHLGHAYTTFVADCLTRFHMMLGDDVFFLTGTDEHGDKIVQAAEKTGQEPQAFVDGVSNTFKDLWKELGIVNNDFIRTTDARHKEVVQKFLQKVYDKGDIYFGEYGGHYCTGCERFYTEKELEDGLCPQHKVKPEYISEKNYFFKMAKYQDALKEHILANPDFIRPERYKNEVLSMLEGGVLEDLCISRPKSRLTWGIELPFDDNFVCYVWFDALINYISALDYPDGEKFAKYWQGSQHLVAKDILKPHAIFWPTMLMAADMPLYQNLNVHGYWLVRDTKMSKSLGNAVDPMDIPKTYGLDAFRYFLMREMHFGSDASFTEEAVISRMNSDLSNDLGNLFSRVLSMAAKYNDSKIPSPAKFNDDDMAIRTLANDAVCNYIQMVKQVKFAAGLEALWELVRALNKYVDTQAPWTLAKNNEFERLNTVMYVLLDGMEKIATTLWAIMPTISSAMLEQLGLQANKDNAPTTDFVAYANTFDNIKVGATLSVKSNLFPRIEVEKPVKVEKPKKENKKEAKKELVENTAGSKDTIDFTDFQKLDLRVGKVLSAEQHPNADKLLKLMIDLGEEAPRQIISGLAEHFKPEDILGKQVCVVCNLAPRKIRGLESNGMVLTAESDKILRLLTADGEVAPGSNIA